MNEPLRRLPALDGLRAVAVLAVLESHVGGAVGRGGFLGVDVFFVLSGYLITRILVAEHGAHGSIELGKFYVKRALRLYPALIAAVGIVLLAPLPASVDKRLSAGLSLTYLMDVARSAGVVNEGQAGPLGVTWSLAVEEHFYLVWPIVVGLALRSRALRRHLPALCAVLAVVAWVSLVGLSIPGWGGLLYFRPDLRSAALFVGCLLAVAPPDRLRPASPRAVVLAAAVLLLLLQVSRGDFVPQFMPILYGFYLPVTWGCVAVIILAVHHDSAGVVGRALAWPPVVQIGKISYGVYLYHLVIIGMVDAADLPVVVKQVLFLVVPVAVAAISFRWLETPFLTLKDARFSRVTASVTD